MPGPSELTDLELHHVDANGVTFAYYEMGTGPLALCLHGYPDSAHTWRHLLPRLAETGHRAVAPFQRGYAPTSIPTDGRYQSGVLGVDANALHEVLGGGSDAVIIGHDWGAIGTYAATVTQPDRWSRAVTMAVPPGPVVAESFFTYEQLRLSWYMFFQLNPLSDLVIGSADWDFIRKLWRDWSPGYDGAADAQHFIDCMATPAHLSAALGYYRQTLQFELQDETLGDAQAATLAVPEVPLLYLHGRTDGCMGASLVERAEQVLVRPDSHAEIVDGAGHFLHLERPGRVNGSILEFLAGD